VVATEATPELIISAASPRQFPSEEAGEPEIAFLGRSNVGKSSLLNALVGKPNLAHTSSRPGCTQLLNFYRVEEGLRFVDLPGYGYALAPVETRARWKQLIDAYLLERRSLALSFLLVDARRGWMAMDLELKAWLEFHNRRYAVIATKADKLKSKNQLKTALAAIEREIPGGQLIAFSAVDGRGVREIWQIISKINNN
jgi:GTP-binding protein